MSVALGDSTDGEKHRRWSRIYLRFIALIFLAIGLLRAAAIIGLTPDNLNILNMTPAWRTGIVTLVSLNLFAAVGLWLAAAWGPVIWAVAAIVEIAMHTLFSDLFGVSYFRVLGHLFLLSIYLLLVLREWRLENHA